MNERRTRLDPVRGSSAERSRRLLTVLPVLLVGVVAVGTVLLTTTDADGPSSLPVTTPATDAVDEGDGTEAQDASEPLELRVVEVILVRDPFEPVVTEAEPAPTPDPSEPADPDDPESPADPSDPAPDDPDDANSPGTPRCSGERELVCNGQVVTLEEITSDADGRRVAVIQVNDFRYVVRPGEPFGTGLELVSLEDGFVRIIFGDQVYRLLLASTPLK